MTAAKNSSLLHPSDGRTPGSRSVMMATDDDGGKGEIDDGGGSNYDDDDVN